MSSRFFMTKSSETIYFEGTYDPNKQCIGIHGDGAAVIKFTTDATQLAKVLSSLAEFKDHRIGISLKRLSKGSQNGKKHSSKTYR